MELNFVLKELLSADIESDSLTEAPEADSTNDALEKSPIWEFSLNDALCIALLSWIDLAAKSFMKLLASFLR